MRALLFGGTGMLGAALAACWRRREAPVLALAWEQADIRDREQMISWAEAFRPQVIVNCAAFTAVDHCEEKRETAFEVNGRAVANVAAAADAVDADLIQISTDYVFDGTAGEPYGEDAPTAPQSVYGASKLLGEEKALEYPRSLVLRTSWLFGAGGPNFVATIRNLLRQGKPPLRVVADQVGCPTWTGSLARAIWDLAPLGQRGIFHYRDREPVSWHGFAEEIARAVDPAAEVAAVTTAEFPRPAPRPAFSVLDVHRFTTAVGRPVASWVPGLASYLDTLEEEDS